jgi:hypothetical protein
MTITLALYAAASLPVALLAARCIEPPKRPHRLRRYKHAVAEAEAAGLHVNWMSHLPPVPPSPRKPESSWLDNVPADCLVDDDPILHRRFFAIVDAESRWFA